MPFEKGHKRLGGRAKGTRNQSTLAYEEVLAKHNFSPLEAMLWVYQESKEQYENYKEKTETGRYSPMEDQSAKYMGICAQMSKEMASYLYSKPKSIELKSAEGSPAIQVIVSDYLTENKE